MPNIGDAIGYWEALREEKEKDRACKRAKVEKLVRRVRACRTLDGLQVVADDARSQGLWHAEKGWLKDTVGECNARLRGRHAPVKYRKDDMVVTVSDNRVVGMAWLSVRDLDAEGWLYAGPAE